MPFTAQDFERKNREIYDDTAGPVWQLAIYGAVHDGHEFINLGGARILDRIAATGSLQPGMHVVDLCAGRGAVCRYLAEHWGCHATGVEWNPKQAEAARALRIRLPQTVAGRIEIVNADCLAWRPEQPADVAVSFDSMMLLPDAPAVLQRMRESLRGGGQAFVVTIGAGEAITEGARQFAWEIDGMASLHNRAEYGRMLTDAGFVKSTVADITEAAIETSKRIQAALEMHRRTIVDLAGEEAFRGWVDVGAQYLSAFESRQFSYLLASASASAANVAITDNAATCRTNYDSTLDRTLTRSPRPLAASGKEITQ